jgi:hypothetical protein
MNLAGSGPDTSGLSLPADLADVDVSWDRSDFIDIHFGRKKKLFG